MGVARNFLRCVKYESALLSRLTMLLVLFPVVLACAVSASSQSSNPDTPRSEFVGDAACTGCHQAMGSSYLHTAHHLTSRLAEARQGAAAGESAFKSFVPPLVVTTVSPQPNEPGLSFRIDERKGRFFESAISGFDPWPHVRTEPIDVITGSGKRGQTYLFWQGERLFELPVSYWTEGSRLVNSPGYQDGTADFSRPVQPGCLECHATYIQSLSKDKGSNSYVRDSLVAGIACETCHGPGLQHGRLMAAKTRLVKGADSQILNPARFSRDRQVDLCGLCHSGIDRESLAPAFSYVPGRRLDEFFRMLTVQHGEQPDVHGNQVGLLKRSRCFTASEQMSCSTCHDTHTPGQSLKTYSDKCLTCHAWQSCGRSKALGAAIRNDCISCHMPEQTTNAIVSRTAGVETRARMRTHWIRIYPDGRTVN